MGDPDIPTPEAHSAVAFVRPQATRSTTATPLTWACRLFREAAAEWYSERFGVSLDPAREVVTLIGSKEGIAHAPLAVS